MSTSCDFNSLEPRTGRASRIAILALMSVASAQTLACGFDTGHRECEVDFDPVFVLDVNEEDLGCKVECPILDAPLPEPQLHCLSDGVEYSCEAWPQGEGLWYSWSTQVGDGIGYTTLTTSPVQVTHCPISTQTATIEVGLTVFNLQGNASSATFTLLCNQAEEEDEIFLLISPDPGE